MVGKTRKRKHIGSRRYAVILPYFLVVVVFLFAFGERLWELTELNGAIREKEIVLNEVKERKEKLEEEKILVTDPSSLQVRMRQLGYIYPGETVHLGADVDD